MAITKQFDKDPLLKQKIAQTHGLNDFSIRELV